MFEDNSPIPGHVPHVVGRLALGAGRHGRRHLVEVPDEDFRFGGAGGEEVLLEGVEVEGLDGAGVLVLGEDEGALRLAGDHLAGVVHCHQALVEAAHDDPGAAESGNDVVSAAPYGSAGILPISWAYIHMLGAEGLKKL